MIVGTIVVLGLLAPGRAPPWTVRSATVSCQPRDVLVGTDDSAATASAAC